MSASTKDTKPGSLERSDGPQMVNAGDLRHDLCHIYDAAVFAVRKLFRSGDIFPNCRADILQRLFLACPLRPATGQPGTGDAEALIGLAKNHAICGHGHMLHRFPDGAGQPIRVTKKGKKDGPRASVTPSGHQRGKEGA